MIRGLVDRVFGLGRGKFVELIEIFRGSGKVPEVQSIEVLILGVLVDYPSFHSSNRPSICFFV